MRTALMFVAVLLITSGCVSVLPEGGYPTKLHLAAVDAPAGSRLIAYGNVDALAQNPDIVRNLNAPPELIAIGSMAIRSARVIIIGDGSSGPDVIVVEAVLDVSSLIPMVVERMSKAGGSELKLVQEKYGGYTIYKMQDLNYFSDGNKIYLGKLDSLKKAIDAKKGASNAVQTYSNLLEKLPDGDVLVCMMPEKQQGSPERMCISAKIRGHEADTTVLGIFSSAEDAADIIAKAKAGLQSGDSPIKLVSVSQDGASVRANFIVDLTKAQLFSSGMTTTAKQVETPMVRCEQETRSCSEYCETSRAKCMANRELAPEECMHLNEGCQQDCKDRMNYCMGIRYEPTPVPSAVSDEEQCLIDQQNCFGDCKNSYSKCIKLGESNCNEYQAKCTLGCNDMAALCFERAQGRQVAPQPVRQPARPTETRVSPPPEFPAEEEEFSLFPTAKKKGYY